ncbi:hypothetical protein FNF27_06483 [Cafeteria roenbergensis]|uniref:Uncharacterized protein n=1 Tax=Cafeteria roenbergensis TaxID=33653 RepID=A0A5A8DZ74_CAFRO|nr:hypothetical protein FNF27_06483 [Cafeteria roenbergensis]
MIARVVARAGPGAAPARACRQAVRRLSSGLAEGRSGAKPTLSGPGSAVHARSWMLKKKTPKEQRSSLVRVAVIAGSVMIVAWIAKTMVWKQGTAEFEELETRRQAMLDEYFATRDQQISPAVDWETVEKQAAAEERILEEAYARLPAAPRA